MIDLRHLMRSGALASALTLISSCVTSLGPAEVERLTTCRNTTLKKVRKNILLAGFQIARESDEDFVTEYKQKGGASRGSRSLMRITVVKIDDGTLRFLPRHKEETYQSISTSETLSVTDQDNHNKTEAGPRTAQSHIVKNENEYDETYSQQHLATYERLQATICGNH